MVGSWAETVAQGWLVFQLTQSPFWVGVISALGFLPILLFGLFGGVISDRFPKKLILLFTQISSMFLSLILAILTFTNMVNLPIISILAFILGIINAIDSPIRFAILPDLVERNDLPSAIALNAGMFNAARVIGPALAGVSIAAFGLSVAFLINALSFVAPIIVLEFLRLPPHKEQVHPHPFESIKIGLKYAFTHKIIRVALVYASTAAIFGWSYMTIMPVISEKVFHQGSTGLGILHSAAGIGAVIGSLIVSAFGKRIKDTFLIFSGSIIFTISMITFSYISNFHVSLIFLLISGVGLVMQNSTLLSIIQHNTPNYIRGRMMSIFTVMMIGMAPFGSLQIGFVSEHLGSQMALRFSSIILITFGSWLFFNLYKLRHKAYS